MTDKELAEKVANGLGWQEDESVGVVFDDKLSEQVFSWTGTGMMIEHMEKLGWNEHTRDCGTSFYLLKQDSLEVILETEFYSHHQYGRHKAVALAFCEAMEIISVTY